MGIVLVNCSVLASLHFYLFPGTRSIIQSQLVPKLILGPCFWKLCAWRDRDASTSMTFCSACIQFFFWNNLHAYKSVKASTTCVSNLLGAHSKGFCGWCVCLFRKSLIHLSSHMEEKQYYLLLLARHCSFLPFFFLFTTVVFPSTPWLHTENSAMQTKHASSEFLSFWPCPGDDKCFCIFTPCLVPGNLHDFMAAAFVPCMNISFKLPPSFKSCWTTTIIIIGCHVYRSLSG